MSETLVGVLQGVITGIGILAAGVGLFAASATGGNFRFVLNDRVVTFQPAARPAVAETATVAAQGTPASEAVTIASHTAPAVAEAASSLVPAPRGDRADTAYYNEIAGDLSLLIVSLKRLGILLADPRPVEEGWRMEIGIVTDALRMGADNLAAVHPTEESIELHSFLMSAANRCARVALALDGDLSRLPVETFQLIGDTLTGCTEDVVTGLQSIN